jgi:hypothetical protein
MLYIGEILVSVLEEAKLLQDRCPQVGSQKPKGLFAIGLGHNSD